MLHGRGCSLESQIVLPLPPVRSMAVATPVRSKAVATPVHSKAVATPVRSKAEMRREGRCTLSPIFCTAPITCHAITCHDAPIIAHIENNSTTLHLFALHADLCSAAALAAVQYFACVSYYCIFTLQYWYGIKIWYN